MDHRCAGKVQKAAAAFFVVLLTVGYLLITSTVAQESQASQATNYTYQVDPLSWGDVYAFDQDAYNGTNYGNGNLDKTIKYYATSDAATETSVKVPTYNVSVTFADHDAPKTKKLTAHAFTHFFQNVTMGEMDAPIGISGVTIPVAETAGTGTYTVVPETAGEYQIYVYSESGAPESVTYALLQDGESANSYTGTATAQISFAPVSGNWYVGTVTVDNIGWTALEVDRIGNTESKNDDGIGTFSGTRLNNTTLGDPTYRNVWSTIQHNYDTLLVLQFPNTVKLGPITKSGSITIHSGDAGTLTVQDIFGRPVATESAVTVSHMPLFITPEATGEAAFSGFDNGGVSSLNGGTVFRFDFEEPVTLTGKWEAMSALPTVTVSGGASAELDFYYAASGSSTITLGNEKSYVFTVDFSGTDGDATVDYAVTGGTASQGENRNGVLSANDNTLTVNACWYNVEVQFTCGGKTITYRLNTTTAGLPVVAAIGETEYNFIEDALAAAGDGQMVTVAADCSFYQGTPKDTWLADANSDTYQDGYTVKTGVQLLVPRSSDDVGTFGEQSDYDQSYANPFAYRKLTVPDGVSVYCLGSINVNSKQYSTSGSNTSRVTGGYGQIILNGTDTQLYLMSGAKLYCFGYITGSGRVEAMSGAEVYEDMQFMDWRGGSNATNWKSGPYQAFPFSQYYIQNVEAPIEFHAGSAANVSVALTASSVAVRTGARYLAQDEGLFRLTEGSLTRTYIPDEDRVVYDLQGTMSVGSIVVNAFVMDVDSAAYVLQLNGSITINVKNGSHMTLSNSYMALPGMEILIEEGASADISGTLYLIDNENWKKESRGTTSTTSNATLKNGGAGLVINSNKIPLTYSPSRTVATSSNYAASSRLVVNGTLRLVNGGKIYTSESVSYNQFTSGSTIYQAVTAEESFKSSPDKGITGTGTIIVEGAPNTEDVALHIMGANSSRFDVSLNCKPALVTLAGLSTSTSDFKSLTTGTYYGLSEENTAGNWYQSIVYLSKEAVEKGYQATAQAPGVGPQEGDPENVIGYTVNGAGVFPFTVTPAADQADWSDGQATGSVDPADGIFTLTGLSGNTTVNLKKYVAQIMGSASVSKYESLADAITAYNAGVQGDAATDAGLPYIQMATDTTEPGFAIDKDVYLDLNGHTVTLEGTDGTLGTLIIDSGATLYGMDSTTDGYEYDETYYGRIKGHVSGKVAVAHETYRLAGGKVRRYVSYQNGDELSFHRYNMSVTKYEFHFRPNGQCDMDFGATFRGSDTVVKLLADMGFKVVENNIVRPGWWSEQYPDRSASQEIGNYPGRSEENPYILQGTLINIGSNEPEEFTKYYDIYALLKFQDDTVVESVPRNLNYLWALRKYYDDPATTQDKKDIIDQFITKNGLGEAWEAAKNQ